MLVRLNGRSWAPVRVRQEQGDQIPGPDLIDTHRAQVALAGGMSALMDREAKSATLVAPSPAPEDVLIHPFLAVVGTAFACWTGAEAFHGGAFASGGNALALVGEREAGKSSTLAALALDGYEVLADDLLVVRDDCVMAGPRCVDLRPSAVAPLGLDPVGGTVRAGERHRLSLASVAPEVPLRGWVFLAWGEGLHVREVPPLERFKRLMALRSVFPEESQKVLDLMRLPAWELRRPHDWSSLAGAVERLLRLAA